MTKKSFIIGGMTCAACQANVTKTVSKIKGVQNVDVNLLTGRMTVIYNESIVNAEDIINNLSASDISNDKVLLLRNEAYEALIGLGVSSIKATNALNEIEITEDSKIEAIIKQIKKS